MKERKASSEWYIAATHFLTAGFVIPLLVTLALGVALGVLFWEGTLLDVGPIVINVLGLWLGVMYSSKYLNKTYVIKDARRIVFLSTSYFVVIGVVLRIADVVKGDFFLYDLVGFVISAVFFHVASRKYVKDNAGAEVKV